MRKKEDKREALIKNQETDEDIILNISLRPAKLKDFIGQKKIVENVIISLEAAKKRKEPLEHVLLSGPPGLGQDPKQHRVDRGRRGRRKRSAGRRWPGWRSSRRAG